VEDDEIPDVSGRSELEVLLEQLQELRGEGVTTGEDALEYATVAGLAARLGPPPGALADAEAHYPPATRSSGRSASRARSITSSRSSSAS
jgi:hypothetical protein